MIHQVQHAAQRAARTGVLPLVLSLSLGVGTLGAAPPLEVKDVEGQAVVKVEGDRLTVKLVQAPLRDVLQEIAQQSGLRILLDPAINGRLSLAFSSLPLEAGLRRLLGDRSVLFLYTSPGEEGGVKLEEVWVYASRQAEPLQHEPPSVGGGDVAQPLREMLMDPEPAQRIAAALALAEGEQAGVALGVLLDLLNQKEPSLREEALAALQAFDAVPVEPIARVALSDKKPSLRLQALTLLGQMAEADPKAREVLRQAAREDRDEAVREGAQALLDSLEGPPGE